MALKNLKWEPGNPKCPNGHLRVLCEVKRVNAKGNVKYECSIRRKGRDQLRQQQIRETKLAGGKPGTIPLTSIGQLGSNAITLRLVCGHLNYQLTKGDNHLQQHWCDKHEDWFEVHTITQWGTTVEVTPLLSRHEINGCTTKTGCTPRCKSEEAPPLLPAVIVHNNRKVHTRGLPKMQNLKGRVLC